jgi:hypothetical protein
VGAFPFPRGKATRTQRFRSDVHTLFDRGYVTVTPDPEALASLGHGVPRVMPQAMSVPPAAALHHLGGVM